MFDKETYLKNIQIWVWCIVLFLGFYILSIWEFIFVPLIVSFFLLILFTWIQSFLKKYLKNGFLSGLVTFLIFLGFVLFVWFILFTQAKWFFDNSEKFLQGFSKIFYSIDEWFSYFWVSTKDYLTFDYLNSLLSKINFSSIWKNIFSTFSSVLSLIWTIIIFLFFIFLERKDFKQKAKYLFDVKGFKVVQNIYLKIQTDLNIYLSTKFFLALFNALVATIIMTLFWLEFALTFGLVVFFMDFIPIVWAIIALWLPFLYSLVTFDSIGASFFMLVCLYIPQIITWNFVEPKFMWERLNLSTLVIIISLLFWWQLWWVMWAFLATPIMAVLNIILSKPPQTKNISILLSKSKK